MTEEKLRPRGEKASKRRIAGLVLAALLLFAAVVWLLRQPIAEGFAQAVCGQQKLTCKIKLTRLDFGGLTIAGLDVRAPDADEAALSASRLDVLLDWNSLLSPRASFVGGDDLVLRLDLTGERPILGDLDQAVKAFTKPNDKQTPLPKLDFKTVRMIAKTVLGPVEARGAVTATGPDTFAIDLAAPAARLGILGARLEMAGAELKANVAGGEIKAHASFDLAKFETNRSSISDVKVDASLVQSAGVLKGEGAAKLGEVSLRDTKLAGAEAKASLVSGAIDPKALDFTAWLNNVRSLSLNASAGEGQVGPLAWKSGVLRANVAPKASPGSGGVLDFVAEQVSVPQGVAGRVEVNGTIDIPVGGDAAASGVLRVRTGALNSSQRQAIVDAVKGPFAAALPGFADAAAQAADRAAQRFEAIAPWSARATKEGADISLLTGAEIHAASGLSIVFDGNAGQEQAATYSTGEKGQWRAAGSVRMSGGGAPQVTLDLARASGHGTAVSLAGAAKLRAWQVKDDVLAGEATGLEFDTTGGAGNASGQFTVSLDGGLGGGQWKAARATGKVDAAWTAATFVANAPRGLVIQWDKAKYGEMEIGAGALHFAPKGKLAERQGNAIVGQGVLTAPETPIAAKTFTARAKLGDTLINWRAEGGLRAGFNAKPTTVDLKLGEQVAPVKFAGITGILDLRRGWRVTGGLSGGEIRAQAATIADAAAKFDLGGQNGILDGSLTAVSMRIFDPGPADSHKFEETKFTGSATLKDSVANFTGAFVLAKPAIEIARVSGQHSLKTGKGELTFAPMPLVFVPRAFQPYHLSPLLRGPANVTGRVDVAGGADWDATGLKAHAKADLKGVGFALASAGVFEGVNGSVEVSDLLNMKSAPGQTITLPKVTLGMPIENGKIRFQLIGLDAIRLEGAEWPFAGGYIRVKPIDYKFGNGGNRVIAQAINWDLNKIVELFKIPDLKLNGFVSGDIPVMFTTGSARIDKAALQASADGGFIQYTGSTGDAAGQSDPNAKMLFDALKDFHYKVLGVGVDGDLAGHINLAMHVKGNNPKVMNGAEFDLTIGIESPLMSLLNMTSVQNLVVSQAKGAPSSD